eukprot:TRINITY_DN23211_c0_g1_i1.p1 TRINITY_DN23211_c0_g1~~TRINITY_DN23211_c0_g1_i1.p1  ORF type:complete len:415 (+),score=73.10 TRINITY_DN23211_c0_g1_i1:47-1246(+)
MGLEDELIPAEGSAAKRFVYVDGGMHQVTLWWIVRRIGLRKLFREFMNWIPQPADPFTETVSDFFARHFGDSMRAVCQCIVSGVFAGDASRLSIADSFPPIFQMQQACGSLIWAGIKSLFGLYMTPSPIPITKQVAALQKKPLYNFKRGMRMLPAGLHNAIKDKVTIRRDMLVVGLGVHPTSVKLVTGEVIECDHVISTISPYYLSPMLSRLQGAPEVCDLQRVLASIPHADLTLVNVMGNTDSIQIPKNLRGFGFLVHDGDILGATMDSCTFPQQYDGVLYKGKQAVAITVMMGGETKTKAWTKKLDAPANARSALEKYAGITLDADNVIFKTTAVQNAIPQYIGGHAAKIAEVKKTLKPYNFSIAGMGTSGIGVNDCLLSGLHAVENLEAEGFFKTA